MRRLLPYALLALLASIPAAHSGAGNLSAGSVVVSASKCANPATAVADGCVNSPSAGLAGASVMYGRTAFFGSWNGSGYTGGYAQQYGQVYKALPPWNVAGVDYPVGIPANVNGTGLLKDPATTQPSGCTYGSETLTCTGAGITVSGYDFSLHNGVEIDCNACTGTMYFTNNYWKRATTITQYFVLKMDGASTADLIATNNYFDNNPTYDTSSAPTSVIAQQGKGSVTSNYNVYYGMRQSAINVGYQPGGLIGGNSLVSQYDYIEGVNYSTDAHGEIFFLSPYNGTTIPLYKVAYTTYLQPSSFGSGVTTFMWINYANCLPCAASPILTNFTLDHTTIIQNLAYFTATVNNSTMTVTAINAQPPSGALNGAPGNPTYVYNALGQTKASKFDSLISGGSQSLGTFGLGTGGHGTIGPETYWYPPVGYVMTYLYDVTFEYGNANLTNNFFDPSGGSACFTREGTITPNLTGNYNMLDGSNLTIDGTCYGTHAYP